MKINIKIISKFRIALCTFLLIFINSTIQSQTVTDFDGNVYQTVKIGNQTWMAENLRTTHFSDGSDINNGNQFTSYPQDVIMEGSDSTKYFFYYNNDSLNGQIYGCLYNWFAAVNSVISSSENPSEIQGVCPSGWHIPSESEWNELKEFVGENSGIKLAVGGNAGFDGLYAGYRRASDTDFGALGNSGFFISSTDFIDSPGFCILYRLFVENNELKWRGHYKTCGYSVRCVKENVGTGIDDENDMEILQSFSLHQNYPNPFNSSTTIAYSLAKSNLVTLKIYNLSGQELETLVNGIQTAGEHEITWQPKGLTSGVYFYKLLAGARVETMKMVLQK
jgi:uncharacterized protein (TIGR02145 family)